MSKSKFFSYKATSKKAYRACNENTKVMLCPPDVFNANMY